MKKLLILLVHILLAVFLIFEYFCFMWYWGGDGAFAFVGCGISFIVFLLIHILLYRKIQNKVAKKIVLYSALILTPILSVAVIYLVLAPVLGITIQVA